MKKDLASKEKENNTAKVRFNIPIRQSTLFSDSNQPISTNTITPSTITSNSPSYGSSRNIFNSNTLSSSNSSISLNNDFGNTVLNNQIGTINRENNYNVFTRNCNCKYEGCRNNPFFIHNPTWKPAHLVKTPEMIDCPFCPFFYKGDHGVAIHKGHQHKCKSCQMIVDKCNCMDH